MGNFISLEEGKIPRDVWLAADSAARMNEGIYYNADFDPSYQDITLKYQDVITANGESLVIGLVEDDMASQNYCVAAFRGREFDLDDYPNACCGDWWNPSCWDNSVDTCTRAVGMDKLSEMTDIRDSSFTTSFYDPWRGIEVCSGMNDELTAAYNNFELNEVLISLQQCMLECECLDGSVCPLYISGHSQGAVYAQMLAMSMKPWLAIQNFGEPYLLTFGAPPAFNDASPCNMDKNFKLSDDHIFNFVNIGSGLTDKNEPTIFDAAVSVGLDKNAAHWSAGNLVLLNENSASDKAIYLKQGSIVSSDFSEPDYSTSWVSKNQQRVEMHLIGTYKERIKSLVASSLGYKLSSEEGFTSGSCYYDGSDNEDFGHCGSGYTCDGSSSGAGIGAIYFRQCK